MTLTWEDVVNYLGDPPIFIPPTDSERSTIMTISENEVAIYQPYYDKLMYWLKRVTAFLGLDAIAVNDYSIGELFGRIAVHFVDLGITITYEIVALMAIVVAYLKNNLVEGLQYEVRETVLVSDDVEVGTAEKRDIPSKTSTEDAALSDILGGIQSS